MPRPGFPGVTAFLLLFLFINFCNTFAATVYVDATATAGAGTGLDWPNAFTNLHDALSAAVSNDQIWVAAGTYAPTTGTNRNATFQMRNGIDIYGGFSGIETNISDRDWRRNVTILSGDPFYDDTGFLNNFENVYHVVTATNNCAIDGFVIRGGHAEGVEGSGGGMIAVNCNSLRISNCVFTFNQAEAGAALYIEACSPLIQKCVFTANRAFGTASSMGGAIDAWQAAMTVSNCVFSGNSALANGGAMTMSDCSPLIANSVYVGNQAISNSGGAIWFDMGSPVIRNCTLADNAANNSLGGGIYAFQSNYSIENSILWGNRDSASTNQIYNETSATSTVAYTCIESGLPGIIGPYNDGMGNIGNDPLCVNGSAGGWTSDPVFDALRYQSSIQDFGGGWMPNELAGKFIQLDDMNPEIMLIASNTTDKVFVWGDLSDRMLMSMSYQIKDYHPKSMAGHWETGLGVWANDTIDSPCIDAGDQASAFANEPAPNGGVINMGAYGNTQEASKSEVADPIWFEIYNVQSPVFTNQPLDFGVRVWKGTNIFSSYTGKVMFASSDTDAMLPPDYAFTTGDAGEHVFSGGATFSESGFHWLDVEDVDNPSATGNREIAVFAGTTIAPEAFMIWDITDPIDTGRWTRVSVAAVDHQMNIATGYAGTVNFTSSDTSAWLPEFNSGSYTFLATDLGVKTFTNDLQFNTIGEHWLKVTDNIYTETWGKVSSISVQGSGTDGTSVTHFALSDIPSRTLTTDIHDLGIEARDQYNRTLESFVGDVTIVCSDPMAMCPTSYTFNVSDMGRFEFFDAVQFQTTGNQYIEVFWNSNTNIKGGLYDIVVEDAMSDGGFSVEMPPAGLVGEAMSFTVKAITHSGIIDSNYTGDITIYTEDPGAIHPANYTFTTGDNGVHTFTNELTFSSTGDQFLEVWDNNNTSRMGSGDIDIYSDGATETTHFVIDMDPRPALSGMWNHTMIIAMGEGNLVNTGHTGQIQFDSSDPAASFNVNPLTGFSNGMAFVSNQVQLNTPGEQQVTVQLSADTNVYGKVDTMVLGGGTVYYVDEANGSDGFDGLSPTSAWQSISYGSSFLSNGDTLIVAPGTYMEYVQLTGPSAPGLPKSLVGDMDGHYFGRHGEVFIDSGGFPAIELYQQSDTFISGFAMLGYSGATGVVIEASTNVYLKDNCIEHWDTGIYAVNTTGLVVRANLIEEGMYAGIELSMDCPGAVIKENEIQQWDSGVTIYTGSDGFVIANNMFHSNMMNSVYISGSPGSITRNRIEGGGTGIYIESLASVVDIMHNIIFKTANPAIHFTSADPGSKALYNTLYSNGSGIDIDFTEGVTVKNNISVYNFGAGIAADASSTNGLVLDYNCVFNNSPDWSGSAVQGSNSISLDPQFADTAPGVEDFHLKSTAGRVSASGWVTDTVDSPCIDAADPADPFSDEPMPNGGRANIGAYGSSPEASRSPVSDVTIAITSPYGAPTPPPSVYTNAIGSILTNLVTSPDTQGTTQYVCTGWAMTGNEPVIGTNSAMTMTHTNNASLTWLWSTNYWLDVLANGQGSANTASGWYPATTNLTLLATPSNGYSFVDWTGDIVSTNNPLNLTMDQRYSVTANFNLNMYDVTATAPVGGSISPTGTSWVTYSSNIVYSITPDSNYHITDVIVDSTSIGPTNSYTFVNVTNGGHTIDAVFGIDQYSLAVSSSHGTVTPAPGVYTNAYGSVLTNSVTTPDTQGTTQYVCNGWAMAGNDPVSGAGNTMIMTHTNNASLTWLWSTNYWGQWQVASGQGQIDHSSGWYPAETNFSLLATPSNGYSFVNWSGDTNSASNPLPVTMGRAYSINANFAIDTYSITATAGPGGSISPSGTVVIAHGSNRTFSISADANYHVDNVTVDGTPIGPTNSYTFVNVTNSHTITATFAVDTYTLGVASAYGVPTPSGVTTHSWNSVINASVSGSPVMNGTTQYVCSGWSGTGDAGSGTGTTNSFNITQDSTITWAWQPQYWGQWQVASGIGQVSEASGWYNSGANVSITATPSNGYHFAGWTGDVPLANTNDNPVTLTMDQARDISVNFELDIGDVTITLSPPDAVAAGAQWRLTSGPDTSWHNSGFVLTGLPGDQAPYTATFNNVTGWTKPGDLTGIGVTHAGLTSNEVSYLTGDMALITSDTFMMGIYNGDGGHQVTLSDFYLDIKEVTVNQYQQFCSDTGNPMPPAPPWGWTNTNLPIVNVTWQEAAAYAAWAGKRLPTEAEFEYAMRNGNPDSLYPWGDSIGAGNANYNNNVGTPTQAGSYPVSSYGLYDIAGNVWEWCSDWYASSLTGPVTDPAGPASGEYKCIRSGSYINSSLRLRCGPRFHVERLGTRYNDLGFRCAADAVSGDALPEETDADSNGIPEWWQQWYFGLAVGSDSSGFDANADSDGDGLDNYGEYVAGTDPTNTVSVLKMEKPEADKDGFIITWPSAPGKLYTIERCKNLTDGFSSIAENISATPPVNSYRDTTRTEEKTFFYRVKVQQ